MVLMITIKNTAVGYQEINGILMSLLFSTVAARHYTWIHAVKKYRKFLEVKKVGCLEVKRWKGTESEGG